MKCDKCDVCGKQITGRYAVTDNDLVMCPECFIDVYWFSGIEEMLGVEVIELSEKCIAKVSGVVLNEPKTT